MSISKHATHCVICNAELTGSKKKFCSRKCLNQDLNHRHKSYEKQQERGHTRKQILIDSKGGKCGNCGYNKCIASLSFHHRIPKDKSFNLDCRSLSNRGWDVILIEAEKTDLLCLNCHAELHFTTHY